MEETSLISVIIPVYNVEKYINRCIESVRNQTYKNLEIILVDDGSTDQSGKICEHYREEDDRIVVIHKENGGLSSARNAGIEHINGRFFMCVDSDDFIEKEMIEILYHNLKMYHADLSVCNYCYFFENGTKKLHGTGNIKGLFSQKKAIELIGLGKDFTGSAWGKLYRKEIFGDLRYPHGKLCEDQFVIYHLLLRCKNIYFDGNPFYYYVQRSGSIMSNETSVRMLDVVQASKENEQLIQNVYPDMHYIGILRRVEAYFEVANRLDTDDLKNERFQEFICEMQQFLRKNIKGILKDTKNCYSKLMKIYCIFASVNAVQFIKWHSLWKKSRGKRWKICQK